MCFRLIDISTCAGVNDPLITTTLIGWILCIPRSTSVQTAQNPTDQNGTTLIGWILCIPRGTRLQTAQNPTDQNGTR